MSLVTRAGVSFCTQSWCFPRCPHIFCLTSQRSVVFSDHCERVLLLQRHLLLRGGRPYPAGRSCAAPCSLLDSSSKSASHQNFPLCSAASGLFRNETVVSLYFVQKVSACLAYGAWAASAVKDGLSLALDRYSAMVHPQSKRRVVSNWSHGCCV